jgi:hypothetical protein
LFKVGYSSTSAAIRAATSHCILSNMSSLQTIGAYIALGGIITSLNAGWELSKKVRNKVAKKEAERKARIIRQDLYEIRKLGALTSKEYDYWYRRFRDAEASANSKSYASLVDQSYDNS